MVRHFGEAAPGPHPGLLLPPDPATVAGTPYWVFHPFGVEAKRADALRRVAAEAPRLEAAPDAVSATARLTAISGIGGWTAAEVVRLAFGDPDAVTIGDYHIPHHVVHALTGAPRAGSRVSRPGEVSPADARMLELLEPFRGQRARVCQLLLATAGGAPRFGPRMPVRSFAHY
jgi:3-methyladenine DNA glycosylase/8-oxoguanine DNA glycosylase